MREKLEGKGARGLRGVVSTLRGGVIKLIKCVGVEVWLKRGLAPRMR